MNSPTRFSLVVSTCLGLAAIGTGCGRAKSSDSSAAPSAGSASAAPSASPAPTAAPADSNAYTPPTDLASAQAEALGAWTHAGLVSSVPYWGKIVFKKNLNGRLIYMIYQAKPTDDDWPRDLTYGGYWTLQTGKFPDTGQRYFQILLSPEGFTPERDEDSADLFDYVGQLTFTDDGLAATGRMNDKDPSAPAIYFVKGDTHPFSK
jgi:hypothetical protein